MDHKWTVTNEGDILDWNMRRLRSSCVNIKYNNRSTTPIYLHYRLDLPWILTFSLHCIGSNVMYLDIRISGCLYKGLSWLTTIYCVKLLTQCCWQPPWETVGPEEEDLRHENDLFTKKINTISPSVTTICVLQWDPALGQMDSRAWNVWSDWWDVVFTSVMEAVTTSLLSGLEDN